MMLLGEHYKNEFIFTFNKDVNIPSIKRETKGFFITPNDHFN